MKIYSLPWLFFFLNIFTILLLFVKFIVRGYRPLVRLYCTPASLGAWNGRSEPTEWIWITGGRLSALFLTRIALVLSSHCKYLAIDWRKSIHVYALGTNTSAR